MSGSPRPPSVRDALLKARNEKRCALIPYITLGYPSLSASLALLAELEDMGADVVEVGVPFSDPVADGPTIQRTIDHALGQGVSLRKVLTSLRGSVGGPRLLFSYLNPLLSYGLAQLPQALGEAGVSGVLVTDLVPEEADEWTQVASAGGVETCFLVAATSDRQRLETAARASTGFVYCVSTLGVTGARKQIDPRAEETVRRLRDASDAPVAVGFGLSTPEDVAAIARFADGAVIGSALMNALGDAESPEETARRGREFLEPILQALRAAG